MALEYLPIMAKSSAPKPPRILASPSRPVVVTTVQNGERITGCTFDKRRFAA